MSSSLPFFAPSLLALSLLVVAPQHSAESAHATQRPSVLVADSGSVLLQGRVVMSDWREPVRDAEVWVEGTPARTRTDAVGHFRLSVPGADTLWVRARHFGFFPARGAIIRRPGAVITLEVGMDPMVRCLDCMAESVATPGYVHVVP